MRRAVVIALLLLAACGDGGTELKERSRTDCRQTADGRTVCTTYEVKQ